MSLADLVSKAKAYLGLASAAAADVDAAAGGAGLTPATVLDIVKDFVGVPTSEISTIATAFQAAAPAIAAIKTGDKLQIVKGLFALAISAERIVVVFDPGAAAAEVATALAEPLVALVVANATPADADSAVMQDRSGPANVSG